MTRPPAPALTAEERAVVARFEAAPYPAEVLLSHLESVRAALAEDRVETVARAMTEAAGYPWPEGDGAWSKHEREFWRMCAAAAIAALP